MTDLETAIMIKNMARETVRRMTAKNAPDFNGFIRKLQSKGYEVRLHDNGKSVKGLDGRAYVSGYMNKRGSNQNYSLKIYEDGKVSATGTMPGSNDLTFTL